MKLFDSPTAQYSRRFTCLRRGIRSTALGSATGTKFGELIVDSPSTLGCRQGH